jgi:hypothetical protein
MLFQEQINLIQNLKRAQGILLFLPTIDQTQYRLFYVEIMIWPQGILIQ